MILYSMFHKLWGQKFREKVGVLIIALEKKLFFTLCHMKNCKGLIPSPLDASQGQNLDPYLLLLNLPTGCPSCYINWSRVHDPFLSLLSFIDSSFTVLKKQNTTEQTNKKQHKTVC